VRIWLAQINSAVDDISGNVEKIMAFCAEAATLSVDVVVFHDMAVCGYPHGDLLRRHQRPPDRPGPGRFAAGPRYGFSRHSRRTRRLDGKMLRQIQAPKNRASSLDGELRVIIREDHRI